MANMYCARILQVSTCDTIGFEHQTLKSQPSALPTKKKVKVKVYSPDVPNRFSGLYINYPTSIGTHSFTILVQISPVGSVGFTLITPGIGTHSFTTSLRRMQPNFLLLWPFAQYQFSFHLIPNYCVDRGGVDSKLAQDFHD